MGEIVQNKLDKIPMCLNIVQGHFHNLVGGSSGMSENYIECIENTKKYNRKRILVYYWLSTEWHLHRQSNLITEL